MCFLLYAIDLRDAGDDAPGATFVLAVLRVPREQQFLLNANLEEKKNDRDGRYDSHERRRLPNKETRDEDKDSRVSGMAQICVNAAGHKVAAGARLGRNL